MKAIINTNIIMPDHMIANGAIVMDGDKIVDQIELKNDGAETSKGIYIGSASADVEKKHGAPDKSTDSSIQYISGNKYLKFGIENGEVKSISLLRVTG